MTSDVNNIVKTIYARFWTQSLSQPSPVFSDTILLKLPAAVQPPSAIEVATTSLQTGVCKDVVCPPDQPPTTIEVELQYFSTPLYPGLRSNEVKSLQSFLSRYKDIYPEGLITGWFGPLTRSAVQRFQCKYEILCESQDPVLRLSQDLTAYGYVGPKTRAKINELFNLQPITDNLRLTTNNGEQIRLIQEKLNDLQSQLTEILNQLVERLKNQSAY